MPNTDDTPDLSALWPLLPPWIEWVAMMDYFAWVAFIAEPEIFDDVIGWIATDSAVFSFEIPDEYAPTWRGDWRKSLMRRPKG